MTRDDEGHPELRYVDEEEAIEEHEVFVGDCVDVFFAACAPRMIPAPPGMDRPLVPRME